MADIIGNIDQKLSKLNIPEIIYNKMKIYKNIFDDSIWLRSLKRTNMFLEIASSFVIHPL